MIRSILFLLVVLNWSSAKVIDENRPSNELVDKFRNSFDSIDLPELPEEISLNYPHSILDKTNFYDTLWHTDDPVQNSFFTDLKKNKKAIRLAIDDESNEIAAVRLTFLFPFYNRVILGVTIARNGFLFLTEHVNTWLDTTRYIAPLMSRFNASAGLNSSVYYYDNGTTFTVEWENFYLPEQSDNRTQTAGKPFSFQVTLRNNGDIIFVYNRIPFPLSMAKHPIKIGFSDKYHIVSHDEFFIRRYMNYEHTGQLNSTTDIHIGSNSSIYNEALDTCYVFFDCESCTTRKLKKEQFDLRSLFDRGALKMSAGIRCNWCPSTKRCYEHTNGEKRRVWNRCDVGTVNETLKCPSSPINDQSKALESEYRNDEQTDKKSCKNDVIFIIIILVLVAIIIYLAMVAYWNSQSKF